MYRDFKTTRTASLISDSSQREQERLTSSRIKLWVSVWKSSALTTGPRLSGSLPTPSRGSVVSTLDFQTLMLSSILVEVSLSCSLSLFALSHRLKLHSIHYQDISKLHKQLLGEQKFIDCGSKCILFMYCICRCVLQDGLAFAPCSSLSL